MAFKFLNSFLGWVVGLPPDFHENAKATIAQAKRYSERFTDAGWIKYFAATRIAVNAGVLRECSEDPGHYFSGSEGIEKAYKLGNAEFTAGKLGETFESRQEMVGVIKFVIYDNSSSLSAKSDRLLGERTSTFQRVERCYRWRLHYSL